MSGYGSMSGEGREGTGQMKDDLQQKTGDAVEQAKQKTGEAMDQARDSAFRMMDEQKTRAADGLGSVASAMRKTGEGLRDGEQAMLGQYAERAAGTVERIAGQLRDKDVDELLYEAERFARREPEMFLGGAVLLGLLASRFFKASNSRRASMRQNLPAEYRPSGSYGSYSGGFGSESGAYGGRSHGSESGSYTGDAGSYRTTGSGGYRSPGTASTGGQSTGSGSMSGQRTGMGSTAGGSTGGSGSYSGTSFGSESASSGGRTGSSMSGQGGSTDWTGSEDDPTRKADNSQA